MDDKGQQAQQHADVQVNVVDVKIVEEMVDAEMGPGAQQPDGDPTPEAIGAAGDPPGLPKDRAPQEQVGGQADEAGLGDDVEVIVVGVPQRDGPVDERKS